MSFRSTVKKWLSLNRLEVIHEQYIATKGNIRPRNVHERHEFAFYTAGFEKYYRKTSRLTNIRVLLYCILYASIVVSVLQFVPLLSYVAGIVQVVGALGGGLAFVLIFIVTVRINVHLQRLQACLTPLVILAQMNGKRDTGASLSMMKNVI